MSLVSIILLWVVDFIIDASLDIANYIYENPKALDLNLQGIWISDRECELPVSSQFTNQLTVATASLSWNVVQEQIPAVNFVNKYKHVFAFKFVLLPNTPVSS
jgi:hypothetical protein